MAGLAKEKCQCSVCEVGQTAGLAYITYKKSATNPVGRPRVNPVPPDPKPVKVCDLCLGEWGPGKGHKCTRAAKIENVGCAVKRTLSDKSRERFISGGLKEIFEEKGVTTRGGTVSLATGGRPITTTLGKVDVIPRPFWSNKDLGRFQVQASLSDNKMKKLGNFIRREAGRGSIAVSYTHQTLPTNREV